MKDLEVYCEKINDDYKCRACEGTNRNKTDDEIKRLYPIKLEDMKDLLENREKLFWQSLLKFLSYFL